MQRQPSDPDGFKERAVASYGLGDKAGALADLEAALRGYRRNGDTTAADRVERDDESDQRRKGADAVA